MNRFFFGTCLVMIVLLLAVIALRPIATPQTAVAAAHYQYIVISTTASLGQIQAELNKRAVAGWELAAPFVPREFGGVTLILRKPTD